MTPPFHTEREVRVIAATAALMRAYAELEREEGASHPSHGRDVADAVHVVQRVVAMRFARRADPFAWRAA